jgi:hypothetical protein
MECLTTTFFSLSSFAWKPGFFLDALSRQAAVFLLAKEKLEQL